MIADQTRLNGAVFLKPEEIPTQWYNILADLPEPLPPPLDPKTKQPVPPQALERLWPKELIRQEVAAERFIPIPEEVLRTYLQVIPRPTPLKRAKRLEDHLQTPAQIYYKCEYISPPGSHKPNTAIAQAYYNKAEGVGRLVTETGAGQWGSALALAASIFGLKLRVYMVKVSYQQKPGRRIMMESYGAEVVPSPSNETNFGKRVQQSNPNHPGSLGVAISEALEDTVTHDNTRYSLGSVLNHVLLHQTIVGQEAKKQMEKVGAYPDVVAGCIGGGSNFSGLAYPFLMDKLHGKSSTDFVACEPKAVPSTTKGVYTYDFADAAETTPLVKMHTIGHDYVPPPIHAGGLRYHGKAPSLCLLIDKGFVRSLAYHQNEVFQAARLFAQSEGILPAPEAAHNVKFVIDEALRCRSTGEKKVILTNLCGHGLLDMKAYEDFLAGRLQDYEPTEIRVPHYM